MSNEPAGHVVSISMGFFFLFFFFLTSNISLFITSSLGLKLDKRHIDRLESASNHLQLSIVEASVDELIQQCLTYATRAAVHTSLE